TKGTVAPSAKSAAAASTWAGRQSASAAIAATCGGSSCGLEAISACILRDPGGDPQGPEPWPRQRGYDARGDPGRGMAEPIERVLHQEASDADLMARVRAGDRDAFGDLVDRHKDAVVNYLTRLTGSRDRAEDLGQETFLRLFRSAGGYVEQG